MRGRVFYKMSGSGNDFVILDGRQTPPDAWPADRIAAVCDRRMGIGADGFVILTPEGPDQVRMDFWNCDGSRAEMCGNAALCSTRLAATLEMTRPAGMQLVTRAGTFPVECRPGSGELAALNLPDFPVPAPVPGISAAPGEGLILLATVGVPHLIVEVADLQREGLMERGAELRSHPILGPAGANVNFVAPGEGSARWRVRTYERGVEGETLACGTGAVAVAVGLVQEGRTKFPVEIETRSGRLLQVSATSAEGWARQVWLAGEGRLVFTGVL